MNRTDPHPWWIRFASLYAALGLFFGWYATLYFRRYPVGGAQRAALYVCLMLLLALAVAPGFPALRSRLRERVHGLPGAAGCVLLFLLPYFLYCASTGDFRWPALATLFGLSALPFGLSAAAPVRRPERMNWQDALVLLWLMVPVMFGQIGGIWNVPANLDFMAQLFLIGVGAWSFLIWRDVGRIGIRISPLTRDRSGRARILRRVCRSRGPARIRPSLYRLEPAMARLPVPPLRLPYDLPFHRSCGGTVLSRTASEPPGRLAALTLRSPALAAALFGMSHIRHAPFPTGAMWPWRR